MLFLLQNPVHDVVKLVEDDNLDQANKIYAEKIQGDKSKEEKLKVKLEDKLEEVQKDFVDKKDTYEESEKILNAIGKVTIQVSNFTEVRQSIKNLNNSRLAYESAQEAIKDNSYVEALRQLKNVIEEDENYQKAQQDIGEISKKYEEDIVKKIDNMVADKKYEDAESIIEKALTVLTDNEKLNETIKSMTVASIAFDVNGLPIKIKGQYSFGDIDYEFLGNADDVNILPGKTYGSEVGWSLDESHGITYVLSCVKEAEFYNGETWTNPYYDYWKQEYVEKELPKELR